MLRKISDFLWKYVYRRRALQQPAGKIRSIGALRFFKTPAGTSVIVLPGCRLPPGHLIPENWGDSKENQDVGNVRRVYRVNRLANGERTGFFVKSPEPHLPQSVLAGLGKKETKAAYSEAFKEARILLKLAQHEITAEAPLALILHPSGQRQLVTTPLEKKRLKGIGWEQALEQLRERIRKAGLNPHYDYAHPSNLIPLGDRLAVIDVNRWRDPAGKYEKRELNALKDRLKLETPEIRFRRSA